MDEPARSCIGQAEDLLRRCKGKRLAEAEALVQAAAVYAEIAKVYAMDELTETIKGAVKNGAIQTRSLF